MKFEDLKFMSLGGNCAALALLGKERIRGPVDNLAGVKNKLCFESLLNDTFLKDFEKTPIISDRVPNFEKDSDKQYTYEHYAVCHNNPTTEKFKLEIEKRYNNFKDFYAQISETDHYFIYCLNTEISKASHTVQNPKLLKAEIDFLKKKNILQKVIFVETKTDNKKSNWNFWAEDLAKFKIPLHVRIYDLDIWNPEKTQTQFKEKICELLGTD